MPWFGSGQQAAQQPGPNIPTQSWYPASMLSSSTSSTQLSNPANAQTSVSTRTNVDSRPLSPPYTQLSPSAGASILAQLKEKRVEDLQKLLTDKKAYNEVLHSIDQVKDQEALYKELRKETEGLAKKNLDKESLISELKNQCTVIRTSELASAQEKFRELEKRVREASSFYAPGVLLERLQCSAKAVEEESEVLHQDLMDGKIELNDFIQKYKKLRTLYHRRSLLHLAAKFHVHSETVVK